MGEAGRRRRRVEPTDEWEQLAYEEVRPLVLFGLPVPERAEQTGSSERTLYRRIARFEAEGMDSLFAAESSGRRALSPVIRRFIVDLKAEHPPMRHHEISTVCYVRFGGLRAALVREGIHLSARTVGRILAVNRSTYGLEKPKGPAKEKKGMPFVTERRHQFWSADVRHLDVVDEGLVGSKAYAITILDNYSRAVVASAVSPTQDLSVLHRAVEKHGPPEALVTDSGSVFRANRARAVYDKLGIKKHEIEKGKPWQSYLETAFNVQRRMADWHFAKAKSWPELHRAHARWVEEYKWDETAETGW